MELTQGNESLALRNFAKLDKRHQEEMIRRVCKCLLNNNSQHVPVRREELSKIVSDIVDKARVLDPVLVESQQVLDEIGYNIVELRVKKRSASAASTGPATSKHGNSATQTLTQVLPSQFHSNNSATQTEVTATQTPVSGLSRYYILTSQLNSNHLVGFILSEKDRAITGLVGILASIIALDSSFEISEDQMFAQLTKLGIPKDGSVPYLGRIDLFIETDLTRAMYFERYKKLVNNANDQKMYLTFGSRLYAEMPLQRLLYLVERFTNQILDEAAKNDIKLRYESGNLSNSQ